jgi:hypothetical protein
VAIRSSGPITKDFIAGFFEAEGSACWSVYGPWVDMSQNNKDILERIQSQLPDSYLWQESRGTWYLRFYTWKRVRPLALLLARSYLSTKRKRQLVFVFQHLKITPQFRSQPSVDWLRGFLWGEGYQTHITSVSGKQYPVFGCSQKSPEVLYKINKLLKRKKVKGHLYHWHQGGPQLRILGFQNLQRFKEVLQIES